MRDTILFVNSIRDNTLAALDGYEKQFGSKLKALVIVDQKSQKQLTKILPSSGAKLESVVCNLDSPVAIADALKPYREKLLAISCQYENSIPAFSKVIPHVPYLHSPTVESLDWATDKIKMRRMLWNNDPKSSPKYTVVHDNSKESIAKIKRKVGFPLIVKPAGLAASLLVTICYHEEELEATLKTVTKKIEKVYKERMGRGKPQILVEEFMEGTMYSIDVYVNERGTMHSTPLVHIRTGRDMGSDDFYGYKQMTPVKLLRYKQHEAEVVAKEAVRALGLRSITAHVELMRLETGWKVIEVAPRIGGYRDRLYFKSFGINHILNDILVRMPLRPKIPRTTRGYTAAMKIYADGEGVLQSIKGLKKVRELTSMDTLKVRKKKGDICRYARHGGTAVVEAILHNASRSDLLADIRRLEKTLEIVIEPKKKKA